MTDEPAGPDIPALQAALRNRLVDCSSCGEDNWSLPPGTNMIDPAYGPDGELDFALGFEVVAAICKTCGFVVLHHTGRLLG